MTIRRFIDPSELELLTGKLDGFQGLEVFYTL